MAKVDIYIECRDLKNMDWNTPINIQGHWAGKTDAICVVYVQTINNKY